MLGDITKCLCKVLQQIRDNESVVDACLGCSAEVVKYVTIMSLGVINLCMSVMVR
jgi:hypothetical protein